MRFMSWNCCWKLDQKVSALLAQAPDIAIIQECSKQSLQNLPSGYQGQWLAGADDHGLGLILRAPYTLSGIKNASSHDLFVSVDIASPVKLRLVAGWNCPPKGTSYIEHAHNFLDSHSDWFEDSSVVFAGDLNSQSRASFDTGLRRHSDLEQRLLDKGLVDAYAAVRSDANPDAREATYRHQWNHSKGFHLDYVYVPKAWVPRISSFAVGAPMFWSQFSDHSPLMLSVNDV